MQEPNDGLVKAFRHKRKPGSVRSKRYDNRCPRHVVLFQALSLKLRKHNEAGAPRVCNTADSRTQGTIKDAVLQRWYGDSIAALEVYNGRDTRNLAQYNGKATRRITPEC